MNRLTRDQILHRALNNADLPSLDAKCRPSGLIEEGSLIIDFLQDGLDYFMHAWPWAATVQTLPLTVLAGVEAYDLAPDHIIDVRDGLLVQDANGRVTRTRRSSMEDLLNMRAQSPAPGRPTRYVITPPLIRLFPTADQGYTVTVYYYALPPVLPDAVATPTFPSDYALVEYVRLRCHEWVHNPDTPVGTAQGFAERIIGKLQASGQGREAMRTDIPIDPDVLPRQPSESPIGIGDRNRWMGNV